MSGLKVGCSWTKYITVLGGAKAKELTRLLAYHVTYQHGT